MKKLFLSVFLSNAFLFTVVAQKCVTMENLQEMIKNDSSLIDSMNKNEQQTQEWIKNNPQSRLYHAQTSHQQYQPIQGFTPTGNPKVDAINYQSAKEELLKNDPKEYKKLFGNPAIDKKTERRKKKHRAQMIKKEKQSTHQ